jgi:hypothetical protein
MKIMKNLSQDSQTLGQDFNPYFLNMKQESQPLDHDVQLQNAELPIIKAAGTYIYC